MTPDFNASLDFLRRIYPSGPWMLTAISQDKKSIETRTFSSSDQDDVLAWLQLHRMKNLYYSVNEPVPEAYQKSKMRKSEIRVAHFLHVDVDPRVGEDLEAEQSRIFVMLESYKIKPSVIVFSGGGYNALWRLDAPVPIADGAPSEEEAVARAVDFERANWQFELDFSTPDHCRDVSRILRLPGTINRPSKEKIEKGRVPALARVVWSSDVSYPLAGFMKVPHVSSNVGSSSASSARSTRVQENVERVETLDSLPRSVPDGLKVIIAQGFDPADHGRWKGDRSAALYYVCCELVRSGVSDAVILGIITDRRFLISESVLDKGNGMMRYATRQVQRARDYADHPMLSEMNEKYAVVLSYGSAPAVMVERGIPRRCGNIVVEGEYEPTFCSFRAFRDRIKNYPAIIWKDEKGKDKSISAFDWWTSHPRRRTYLNVTFEPGIDTPESYNLWTGFSVKPIAGDRHERWLKHVFEIVCAGNQEHFDYLIRWCARVVQQPRTQSMVALVLLGSRGAGKSIFSSFFSELFHPHRYIASDVDQLTGKFNNHLSTSLVVVAEEAYDLKSHRHEGTLKERITGHLIPIERKGVDTISLPNYIHLIMLSNLERVVPAGDRERRFFVIRCLDDKIGDAEYFDQILADMRSGGLENLLHFLMSVDISRFNVTRIPHAPELRKQQEHNLSMEMEWLLAKLTDGQWFADGRAPWRGPVRKKALHEDYRVYMANLNARWIKGERAFHAMIMDQLPGTTDRQIRGKEPHDRPMVFDFPSLEECRAAFDKRRGWSAQWRAIGEPERHGECQGDLGGEGDAGSNPFE